MRNRVGVVGLPDLARHLHGAGYDVVTADSFRSAAATVHHTIAAEGTFPVLVADAGDAFAPHTAVARWVAGAATAATVVVVRLAGAAQFPHPDTVTAPLPVSDLLARVGLAHEYPLAGRVEPSGQVTTPPVAPTPSSPAALVQTPARVPADPPVGAVAGGGYRAETVLLFAGKGGVGKTTAALTLAQHAAAAGPDGFRVTLIDGNRGQGDVCTYLGMYRAPIPTVYDIVLTGDPGTALVTPSQIAAYRDDPTRAQFALAAAPPGDAARSVPATAYSSVIEHARQVSDLVVIDTQIFEASDSPMWDGVFVPLLMSGAFGMGIIGGSATSLANLAERVRALVARGVPAEHLMWFLNSADGDGQAVAQACQAKMGADARCVGVVRRDPQIAAQMSSGHLPVDNPDLRRVAFTALSAITGRTEFAPVPDAPRRRARFGRRRAS